MLVQRSSCIAPVLFALLMVTGAQAAPLIPNDPYYAPYTWQGPMLNLPTAWGYSRGSTSIIAAVLDTGVMADTPDLAGRILPALSATGSSPLDGTQIHHGTWVASGLAMQINNNLGGTGIGNFSILPITVTDSAGHNASEDIAAGIRLAADQGARVINVSQSTLSYGELDAAAAYARTQGALTFVAGGNSNHRVDLGESLPNLIFVAGTDQNDQRWVMNSSVGSTWGPYISLSAPAADILVADPPGNSYGLVSGTSLAAPLAAGAAALAWSINPDLTPDQVQNILFRAAKDLGATGWDEQYGWGRIDVGAVAAAAAATVPEPAALILIGIPALAMLGRRPRRPSAGNAPGLPSV